MDDMLTSLLRFLVVKLILDLMRPHLISAPRVVVL